MQPHRSQLGMASNEIKQPLDDTMASTSTENKEVIIVNEGEAEILFPSSNEVFYNPVQEFNRDMSTAVISLHAKEVLKKKSIQVIFDSRDKQSTVPAENVTKNVIDLGTKEVAGTKSSDQVDQQQTTAAAADNSQESKAFVGEKCEDGIRILEGLSASGLRSIRYAKEIPGVQEVVANDFSARAVENIKRNIKHNGVEDRVTPSHADAMLLMYQNRQYKMRFDVIDLDPYGTAAPFLDGAVQAVKDGGLLCITCTDMAILCGNHAEACFGKYGGMSLATKYCHEMALRIVLQTIETAANRYGRYMVPILSLSVDFYVRMFVRVYTSPATVKFSASKKALVYHCIGCSSFHLQRMGKVTQREKKPPQFTPAIGPPVGTRCDNCGGKFKLGGPIWADPIHNQEFVDQLLTHIQDNQDSFNTSDRMEGTLSVISEELKDCPLYYTTSSLSNIIHTTSMAQLKFRSALLHAGYKVSITHTSAEAVKTDAPPSVVWDIMRAWAKLNPVNEKRLSKTSPATAILKKESSIEVCFDIRSDANPKSRVLKLLRFQENPEANWGPKAKAKISERNEDMLEKRIRLQGKRKAGKTVVNVEEDKNGQQKKHKQESDDQPTNSETPMNIDATNT